MEQNKDLLGALEALSHTGSQHLSEESQQKAAEALLLALQDGLRGNRAVPGNVWAVVEAAERAYPVQQSPSIERARAVADAAPGRDLVATWALQAAADGALGPFVANLRRQPHIASAYAPGALLRDGVKVARLEAAVGRMKGAFPSPFELLQRERGQAPGPGGADAPGAPPPAAAHIQTEADVLPQRGSGDGAAPAAAGPAQEAPAAVAAAGKAGLALARDLSSRVRAGMLWRSGDATSPRSKGPAAAAAAAAVAPLAVCLEVTEMAPGGGVDPLVKLRLQVRAPPGSPVAGGRPHDSTGPVALAAIAASKVASSIQRGVLPALPGNVARAALAAARGAGSAAGGGSGGEPAGAAAAPPGAAEKAPGSGAPAAQLASSVLQGIKQTAEATVAGGQGIGVSVGAALASQVAAVRGGLGLLKPRQASDESQAAATAAAAADSAAAAEEDEDMWSGLRRLGRSQANTSASDTAAAAAPPAEAAATAERRRANEASGAAVAARTVAAARRAAAAAAAAPAGSAIGDEAPALPDLVAALSEALSHGLRRPPPPGGGGGWGVPGLAGWLPSRRCSAFGALQALEAGGRGRPRVLVGVEGIARLQAVRGASDDARLDIWLRSSLNDQLLGARLAALAAAAGRAGLAEWYEPGALLLQGAGAAAGAAPAAVDEGSLQQQEEQDKEEQGKTEGLASLVEAVRGLDGFRFALRMDPGSKQQAADAAAAAQQQQQQSQLDARSPQKQQQQQQQGAGAKAAPVAAAVAAGRGLAVAVTAAPLSLAHQVAGSLSTFQWPSAGRRGAGRRGAAAATAAAGGGGSGGDGSGSEALSPLSSSDEGGEPAWWNGTTWTAASSSSAAAEGTAGSIIGSAGEGGEGSGGQQRLGAGVLVPAAGAAEGAAAGGSRQPSAAEQLLGELEAALAAPVPTLLQGAARSSWHGSPEPPAANPEPAQRPVAAGTGGNGQHARKRSNSFSDMSQLQQQVAAAAATEP